MKANVAARGRAKIGNEAYYRHMRAAAKAQKAGKTVAFKHHAQAMKQEAGK